MYGHERALVEKLSGRPFVLLGVNNDAKIKTVKDAVKENNLNWRSWIDGKGGPIVKQFKVSAFPTLIFVDHVGVIRYKNVRNPEQMDAVLEKMVAAAEGDGMSGGSEPAAAMREFLDVTGKHSTMAAYAGYEEGKVVLTKEDTTEVRVPWKFLSVADRRYIAEKRLNAAGRSRIAKYADKFRFDELTEFTDSSGSNSIKATYIALENGKAILWDENGKEIAVSWKKLSEASREFARQEIKRIKADSDSEE